MVTMANKRKTKRKTLVLILLSPILLLLIIRYFMKIKDLSGNTLKARGCDPQGCGHYGAPRGTRKHEGFDFLIAPHSSFTFPFDVKILRTGIVSTDKPFRLIELTPTKLFTNIIKIKVMYCDLDQYQVNDIVRSGYPIAMSQDNKSYYGGGMQNHLHVEVRIGNQLINPALIFNT